jgi:hypothetical protein
MLRATLSFLSMLAFGVLSAAGIVALLPWLAGHMNPGGGPQGTLQFESVLIGLLLGLLIGAVARYDWADIPRRMVNWVLIRERQLFYGALLSIGLAILVLY